MSQTQVQATTEGSPAAPIDPRRRTFLCSSSTDGLDAAWVHIAGDLDTTTTPHLEQTLRAAQWQARLVVLDLRELVSTDTAGVHAIADASSRGRKIGRRLVVLRGAADVHRMFNLAGRLDEIEILDLDAATPPVQMLLRLAGEGRA
jgi:anti-anti-sigma factor